MALGGGGEGKEEGHPLRCLDAVRYAAASMVTVLILIVIVKATKVVLFPESLYVSVVQGSILITRSLSQPRPTLIFGLNLRIDNPSRGAYMHYVNVTAYLFDNDTPASSSNPENDSIIYFQQQDILVAPHQEAAPSLRLRANRDENFMAQKYFNLLYNDESASMSGVAMRMDAQLIIEGTSRFNITSRRLTYYCWPLVILHHLNFPDDDDVFCRDVWESHFI